MKLMCMFCLAIIALFLTGAFYKGVEMSKRVDWFRIDVMGWV